MRWSDSTSIIGNWNSVRLPLGKGRRHASRTARWGAGAKGALVVLASLAALASANAASSPPRQLYGKSIVVSWTETRSQRLASEQGPFRSVSVSMQRSIYISTEGRPFLRTNVTANLGRRAASGKAEAVGAGGTNFSGGPRSLQFRGNSIVMTGEFKASARRVEINFDSSFQNCSAQAITAKQVGAKMAVWRGIAAQGALLEIESVSAGPASCSVRSGNVFAE